MNQNNFQFLGTLIGIVGLFGWSLKLVLPYLFKKIDEKDAHINNITAKFTDTINHKQNEFTKAIDRLSLAIEKVIKKLEK